MAKRVLKEHDVRKNELLDAAQLLFVERGYDATPVSAIIEAVGVAKGTFYHYFRSKEDLLDAQVARITEIIFSQVSDAMAAGKQGALEKLRIFFAASSKWKVANRDALMAVMRPIYAEETSMLRQKMMRRVSEIGVPILEAVIWQGVEEGSMKTPFPREVAEMLLFTSYALGNENFRLLEGMEDHPENWDLIMRRVKAYEWTSERMLGLPEGALQILDEPSIKGFRPKRKRRAKAGGGQ